ncbi:MAG: thiamine phosphate synthase [Oscillibacter sp.]|nr:thiamine phosphate synthase [Oscillibacter sp.]
MKFTKDEIRKSMLLYAVTDRMWLKEGQTLAAVTEEVLQNGATFLQIREKELDHDAFLAEAMELKAVAERYHVPFVVNDDIDIALACDADGVHVGQSDIVGKDVRAMIGPNKILGISANTVETALAAQAAGADYIGVGAVFATTTKKNAVTLSVPKLLEICGAVDIPVVAIGGIGAGNILQLKGSGVDGVAVVSAIYGQSDPGAAAADMLVLAKEMVAAHG